jgi:hypothetical protein
LSENLLYFCRPHPTSVVGANFCGCIFFDPCSEKNIKKNSKKIKSLIPTSAFWEILGKIQKKEKIGLPIAPHILLSSQVHLAIVTHAQQQITSPLWFGSCLALVRIQARR